MKKLLSITALLFVMITILGARGPQKIRLRFVHESAPVVGINGYYSTQFLTTENPISESSSWVNGAATGGSWKNVQTNGAYAYGSSNNFLTGHYDDSTALLTGTWADNQWAAATVHISGTQSGSGFQEVELRLRSTLSSGVNSGYECLFSVRNGASGQDYAQIVRWNGALDSFKADFAGGTLAHITTNLGRDIADGDVVSCEAQGTTITSYINGVQMVSITDSGVGSFSSGKPGMGFWHNITGGGSTLITDAGFYDFTASNGNLFPITVANTTPTNVQSAVTSSATGDTILLPPGTFTWTSGVTVSKGIRIQGAGGGYVQGRSTDSRLPGGTASTVNCANGSTTCSFTLETASGDGAGNSWVKNFKVGDTVTARFKAKASVFITGTVNSWNSGTGVLTLTVTSNGSDGSAHAAWTFSKEGATKFRYDVDEVTIFNITEQTTQSVELSNMQFEYVYPSVTCSISGHHRCGPFISVNETTNGKPTFVHDVRCQTTGNPSGDIGGGCFNWHTNKGIVWRVYSDCHFDWANMETNPGSGNYECTGQFFHHVIQNAFHSSWTTPSLMGAADTTGTNNVYMEDCFIEGHIQTSSDSDDNARFVMRYCRLDNSGMGTHGQETSLAGMRDIEAYNNTFTFDNLTGDGHLTANQNHYLFIRGGTLVWTDNRITDLLSSDKGDKPEIRVSNIGLNRAGANSGVGINGYACWGNGTSTWSNHGSESYPYPRQFGLGVVSTTNVNTACSTTSGVGPQSDCKDPLLGFRGNAEPAYIWGNTIVGSTFQFTTNEDSGDPCDGTPGLTSNYVQLNRDYFMSTDNTAAKPGYSKYTYPHPLRQYH